MLAVYSPNSIDFPIITWGVHWAGGVLSPANPAYTVDELAFQLRDCGARALVTQRAYLPQAVAAAKKVGMREDMVILMGDERDPAAVHKHFTSVRNISGATRYRRAKVRPAEDLAFLVYSSGTTGHPKGVMLTHRNIVANVLQVRAGESGNLSWKGGADGKGDKILAFLPFFHIYGGWFFFLRLFALPLLFSFLAALGGWLLCFASPFFSPQIEFFLFTFGLLVGGCCASLSSSSSSLLEFNAPGQTQQKLTTPQASTS